MNQTEQKAFNKALLAAYATHKHWLASDAVVESVVTGNVPEIVASMRTNHNQESYAAQSRRFAQEAIELYER